MDSATTKQSLLRARESGADTKFGVERSGKAVSGDVGVLLKKGSPRRAPDSLSAPVSYVLDVFAGMGGLYMFLE
jgi:hypothetical protein